MPDRNLRYILTAQDKGASAAMEKTATSGERAASRIGGAFSKIGGQIGGELGETLDKIGSGLDQLGEHGLKTGAKLTLMGAATTGLGVALMQLGSNEKQATDQLKAAIESTGNSYSDFSEQIEKTIKHQENFGHSAADTDEALRKLTTATQDPQKALNLMGITADLAAAKHISLSDASQLLTRVLGGTGGKVLAQYGITMKKNADGTKDVDGAVAALGQRLQGQASASVDNFSGKVGIVLTKLHDWGAEMGQRFGPAITGVGVAVTAAGTVMQLYQARTAAAAVATDALTVSEVGAAAAADTLGISMTRALGPLGLVVAATVAVGAATGHTGDYISNLAKNGDDYTNSVNKTADALRTNLLTAFEKTGSSQQELITQTVAAGQALGGVQAAVFSSGQSWDVFGKAVTGTDEEFNAYIGTLKEHLKAAGADDATIKFQVGTILRLRDSYTGAKTEADKMAASKTNVSKAAQEEDAFLKANNLTVDQAAAKYNNAVAKAYSFTAQLGYMSKALDTLSNDTINSTLGQLHLTDAIGNATDGWKASRVQVDAHGRSLNVNTEDGRANTEWALGQIQAINAQAISYAKSTGSIGLGTQSLNTNKEALRQSMYQAGFTRAEVDRLLARYAATPGDVKTSIRQQGAEAVEAALGDLEYWLHRIADPNWAAHIDIIAGANAAQGGHTFAMGGLVTGPGGPKGDKIPLWGSDNEYMVQAAAVDKYGVGFFDNLNAMKFASGGLVGRLNLTEAAAIHADISAAEQKARNAAVASFGGGVPGNFSGSMLDWVFGAERATGTPASWTAAILRRIMFESGGNPNAINNWDINAQQGDPSRGLMQTIGSTFNAYHQPGTSSNIYDPVANIAAAINYIKSRYGSIFAIDPPVQGYRDGGTVDRTGLAYLHRGEKVLPADNRGKTPVFELGPRSIAALAEQLVVMDGEAVARLVTKRQTAYAVRGGRR